MLTEALHRTVRGKSLAAQLPLEPIVDECTYWRAIEILDRLFLLRREKSPDEMEYFRALAELVYDYECNK